MSPRTTSRPARPRSADGDPRLARLEQLTRELLIEIGEDPGRAGLARTPNRVARAWFDLTRGYREDVPAIVNGALFDAMGSEMVIVRDIEIMSLCEHHLLPFYGRCHVAYLPDRHVVGLSKICRIVDMFSRRLQVQERITTEVAEAVDRVLKPHGVGVVVEAKHMCMMMRGVEKAHSEAVTSALTGKFKEDPATRAEFLNLIATTLAR
jgi:GTP cyclohydrolase I